MKVIFIGAGNLATRLSLEMQRAGFVVGQVYSRTAESAEALAGRLHCPWTVKPEEISPDGDLYVFALKDSALETILGRIAPNQGLWVHTAGSLPMAVFEGKVTRYGVLYPLQTFSKERAVDFRKIPLFIEASTEADSRWLAEIAGRLSDEVRFLSSEERRCLHLAAVFACNFTNHMYVLAAKLLKEKGIPEGVLRPLIDETAAKIHQMSPLEAQTGPAVRYDENVMNKHLAMLADPDMQALYREISRSIYKEMSHEQH